MPTIEEFKSRLDGVKGHVGGIIWQRADVIGEGHDLGVQLPDEVADDIIDQIDDRSDAGVGITWDTFDFFITEWMEDHPDFVPYANADVIIPDYDPESMKPYPSEIKPGSYTAKAINELIEKYKNNPKTLQFIKDMLEI